MHIIKIPFSAGHLGKNPGTEKAPEAIVKALNINAKEIPINNTNIEESHNNIFTQSQQFLLSQSIFLGGDHSLLYPLFKAVQTVNPDTGFSKIEQQRV